MSKKRTVNMQVPTPLTIKPGILFEANVFGPTINGARDIVYQGNIATARRVASAYNNFDDMLEALRVARTSLGHFKLKNGYDSTALKMIDRVITKAEKDDSRNSN